MNQEERASALDRATRTWEALGEADPLWGVDTTRGFGEEGQEDLFFGKGESEVARVLDLADSLGLAIRFDRALDFGCGVGRLTFALSRRFREVIGVDVSRPMISQALRYRDSVELDEAGRIEFICNQETDLSLFEDESFDFVLSLITLQHIRPVLIERYVEELCRVAGSPGVLVFQLPGRRHGFGKRLLAAGPRRLRELKEGRAEHQVPTMEMHGLPEGEVRRIVRGQGREVALVEPDGHATGWESFTYLVV